ncbi:hypothetical protein ACO2Q3_20800 [Caulobacter sp. KR2-114]|uniref:hypothetical protein n=1 Tax=Caulobacter sp. KR2-114 TaxID=3400912 RepID=UPI003C0F6E69
MIPFKKFKDEEEPSAEEQAEDDNYRDALNASSSSSSPSSASPASSESTPLLPQVNTSMTGAQAANRMLTGVNVITGIATHLVPFPTGVGPAMTVANIALNAMNGPELAWRIRRLTALESLSTNEAAKACMNYAITRLRARQTNARAAMIPGLGAINAVQRGVNKVHKKQNKTLGVQRRTYALEIYEGFVAGDADYEGIIEIICTNEEKQRLRDRGQNGELIVAYALSAARTF